MIREITDVLLSMSFMSSYCILLILPVRFLLSKCERKYAFCLWLAVFLNLAVPFDLYGGFSLIPGQVEELPAAMAAEERAGVPGDAETVFLYNREAKEEEERIMDHTAIRIRIQAARQDSLEGLKQFRRSMKLYESHIWDLPSVWQKLQNMVRIVWLPGVLLILLYHLAYAVQIQRKLSRDHWKSWDQKERAAEVEGLPAPFLWGIFRPVIFLPAGLEEEERRCIIAHENCHRRRMDSVTKPAFFAAAALHWFNPLVWLAWALFCRDMEICCDEAVSAVPGGISRKQYAQTLLRYAAAQNGYRVSSLTFGEPSARMRIRHILRFRKKNIALRSAAGLAAAVMVLGLAVHPVAAKDTPDAKRMADAEPGSIQEPERMAGTESGSIQGAEDTPDAGTGNVQESEHMTDAGTGSVQDSERITAAEADRLQKPGTHPKENTDRSVGSGDAVLLAEAETEPPLCGWSPEHRMGYERPEVTHVIWEDDPYFTPGLRSEEELEMLARTALRELYDLTGYQVERCVYECIDLGTFRFARTPEDLKHSRTFYSRSFGEAQGYDELVVPSMGMASARRFWFSDVQQLDIPQKADEMSDEEMAVWFLEHSAVYQGEEIAYTEPADDVFPGLQQVYLADGTFYEVELEGDFVGVKSIYGPYPKEYEH